MLPFFLAIFLRVFSKLFGMMSWLEDEVVEVSQLFESFTSYRKSLSKFSAGLKWTRGLGRRLLVAG
jgi:hypothetical protein